MRSNALRSPLVTTARDLIYNKNYGVDSTQVESLLKPDSWVPSSNVLFDSLGAFGFNVFVALVVDLLHEFELGVWCMLLLHLLRILFALNKTLIHELDRRYRLVPPFGSATIRRFSANTSEMSNMAACNFEDLLQCSIRFFEGLLPNPHNKIVVNLLFTMAHWHGLAKLWMHSNLTLDILDLQTTKLGEQFRQFKVKVCSAYNTQELDHEVDVRTCRQAKEAARQAEKGGVNGKEATAQKPESGVNTKGTQKASPEQPPDAQLPRQSKKKRSINLNTYKLHALGNCVASICHFGTTDSYSTEPVSLNLSPPHSPTKPPSGGLTQIERRQTQLHHIKEWQQKWAPLVESDKAASDPHLHHHIGQSEKVFDELGHYLCNNARDSAMKDVLPCLKTHILDHLNAGTSGSSAENPTHTDNDRSSIFFKHNRIYHHNLARFNFTSYDVRRSQDVINPKTPHCNIMLLRHDHDDNNLDGNYRYAKVLGIHHVNAVRAGNVYETHRIESLFVRWYQSVQRHDWETYTLGHVPNEPIMIYAYLYDHESKKVFVLVKLDHEEHPFAGFQGHRFVVVGYIAMHDQVSALYCDKSIVEQGPWLEVLHIVRVLTIPDNFNVDHDHPLFEATPGDLDFLIKTPYGRPNILGKAKLMQASIHFNPLLSLKEFPHPTNLTFENNPFTHELLHCPVNEPMASTSGHFMPFTHLTITDQPPLPAPLTAVDDTCLTYLFTTFAPSEDI
ncbi:hypothetical protein EV702DRAFT_1197182 [Suillus placidus]|uniref:Uncharacterized protein n=1 Tax=Suillus placidus TaxID=48579 RepID=A0A9P7D289_9AGAM|nr:hypothetical protein EV702DRAFT_1197182 [Suillus placidus]